MGITYHNTFQVHFSQNIFKESIHFLNFINALIFVKKSSIELSDSFDTRHKKSAHPSKVEFCMGRNFQARNEQRLSLPGPV